MYVGYGIKKKKSKNCLRVDSLFIEKEKFQFSILINRLKIDVCNFKTKIIIKISSLQHLLKNMSPVNKVQSFKNMQLD
jgi:hypothetical protein